MLCWNEFIVARVLKTKPGTMVQSLRSVQERQVGFQLLATPIDRRHLPDGAWKFEDLDTRGAATRIVDGSATAARHRLLVQ